MNRMILVTVLAVSAILYTSEKSQSTQIGSSKVVGLFETGMKNTDTLLCGLVPPIRWPIPPTNVVPA